MSRKRLVLWPDVVSEYWREEHVVIGNWSGPKQWGQWVRPCLPGDFPPLSIHLWLILLSLDFCDLSTAITTTSSAVLLFGSKLQGRCNVRDRRSEGVSVTPLFFYSQNNKSTSSPASTQFTIPKLTGNKSYLAHSSKSPFQFFLSSKFHVFGWIW